MSATDTLSAWDARIARARALAETHESAAGLLAFYAHLAEQQRELASRWMSETRADVATRGDATKGAEWSAAPRPLDPVDSSRALDVVPTMLGWLGCEAPPGLAETMKPLERLDDADWRAAVHGYAADRGEGRDPDLAPVTFVLEVVLQPLAALAGKPTTEALPTAASASSRCPRCESLPVVGVLREEGQGAKRNIVCGLCLHEWPFVRLSCPSCGEHAHEKLPVFTAEQWPTARVEACDSCRVYIKTLDATKDGHIVPVVDDLATVALDLWAREQGYTRLRPSLLGT